MGDLHKVVKSDYTVGTVIIIGILILFFPVSMTEKETVYALSQGTNQSGMVQPIQEQQQRLLQSRINTVKLLADMVQNRLHEASNLLEITSVDPVIQKTPCATSISKVYMGIKVFVMYEPFKVGTHRWGIVLTEPYYQLVGH